MLTSHQTSGKQSGGHGAAALKAEQGGSVCVDLRCEREADTEHMAVGPQGRARRALRGADNTAAAMDMTAIRGGDPSARGLGSGTPSH